MKKSTFALAALACVPALAGFAPEVSNVTFSQPQREVTITYDLAHGPAIVTLDILTNGVSIGAWRLSHLSGDVNRKVTGDGTHTIRWNPLRDWPDQKISENIVSARVTAWAPDNPPDYMVADLTGAEGVKFYESAEALPGGLLSNDIYRTTSLVMRRMHAAGVPWQMGATKIEANRWDIYDAAHTVTLPSDYYIGVFEITGSQWAQLMGSNPSRFWKNSAKRPVTYICYCTLRERAALDKKNSEDRIAAYQYPNAPSSDSFIGQLRRVTGIAFDLPSEAQWEFAARGGHGDGKWGDGSPVLNSATDANMLAQGRFGTNGGFKDGSSKGSTPNDCDVQYGTAEVGSYAPNGYGLYDMCGNVAEICQDFEQKDILGLGGAVNADGSYLLSGAAGGKRTIRGSSWCTTSVREMLICSRVFGDEWYNPDFYGARVACPANFE